MKEKVSLKNRSKNKFDKFETAYNVIFKIDDLKKRFVRSPIEINNNRYIQMWRDCFDRNGRFNRTQFNNYLPLFSEWDNAFYLMWLDLKSIDAKEDRTAIINCLVRFVKDSPHLNEYIDFILKDFFYYPLHLHYSDTNALIFVNMLLFKNFGQRSYDFERTPEEVLGLSHDKDARLVARLSHLMANEWGERFYQKTKTIKKNMDLALEPQKEEAAALPADALMNMLREVLIFLALVGGMAVHKVVRDTVEELGNPNSTWYHSKNSTGNLKNLIQLLQVGIRCLVCFKDKQDTELLRSIKLKEKDFVSLKNILDLDLSFHQKVVKRMISIIDEGIIDLQTPDAAAL